MLLNYIHSENITPERIFHEEPIRWVKIAGLRHRLIHYYEDTNWTVICTIIYDVLPKFLEELKQL